MKILSKIRNYNVEWINDLTLSLEHEINAGDIIIVDKNVVANWDHQFPGTFKNIIKIDATEKQKDYFNIGDIIQQLIEINFKKNGKLICIGGGVTQDICGFISSVIFRGVEWKFYPTTLLAQGDSCIGGKTSVNFGDYKNQLGGFNPPQKVIIYPDFIGSLPIKDIRSGIGEMLHFYLVSGQENFSYYKQQSKAKSGDLACVENLVKRCLEIKKKFIEVDEFDKKERLILNYGHTFGHAIEALTSHSIPHGIAVCMGMDIANYISMHKNYITQQTYKELKSEITSIWQPNLEMKWEGVEYPSLNIEDFAEALTKDKKNTNNNLKCVLTKGVGNMILDEVEYSEIKDYLQQYRLIKE